MTHRVYVTGFMIIVLMGMIMLLPTELFAQRGRGAALPGKGMNQWVWAGRLPVVTMRGVVVVDSSAEVPGRFSPQARIRYFLDTALTAQSSEENIQLFFGPPGYQPAGISLPKRMDTVTVRGGLDTSATPPVLAVYQLNGQQWRDTTGAPAWGTWIRRNSADSVRVTNGTDSLVTLWIPAGAFSRGQMPGGMAWPDSMLVFINEFSPESLYTPMTGRILTGIYITFLGPDGNPLMQRGLPGNDSSGFGTITFNKPIRLQFHLEVDTTVDVKRNFSAYVVSYLANDSTWRTATNVSVDSAAGNITVIDSVLASYYALSAPTALAVEPMDNGLPEAFALQQNYPNPFNPSTTIEFSLPSTAPVRLEIFDLLGQNVATLVSGTLTAGTYKTQWNAAGMASGVYFYRLVTPGFTKTKSLMLLK